MEFINRMKKREFIEMALKTIIALLAGFIAIILMEGMIYSITLNSYMTNGTTYVTQGEDSTTAYCIEVEDGKYFVLVNNVWADGTDSWSASAETKLTKAECEALDAKVVFHAPNAFVFSISGVHYVIMAVFMLAIGGFFAYRFVCLNREYARITDKFNKTGEIELFNM